MRLSVDGYAKVYSYGLLSVLMLLGAAVGLWQEIIILTLPDLHIKFHISYEFLGNALSFRGIGNIVSLLAVSYIYDSYPHTIYYLLFLECVIGGICTISIPWCPSFYVAATLIYLQSICQSALNNACQVFVLQIFNKNSIGKMQMYHFGYGFGRFLTGFICRPFVSKYPDYEGKLTKYCSDKMAELKENVTEKSLLNISSNIELNMQPHRFEYAYLLAGLLVILIATVFMIFKLAPSPFRAEEKKVSWSESIHPKFTANGRICFGGTLTVVLFLYYVFYLAGQSVFLPYLIVYAMDPCKKYHLSQSRATYLHTVVTACFISAQLATCLIMDKYPVAILLTFNSLNVVAVAILATYGDECELVLWICVCLMRVCNSVVYPIGTSYLNRFIVVSSSLITLSFIGATCGVIIGQALGARIMDNYPSVYVLYACLVFMVGLLLVSIVFVVVTSTTKTRVFDVNTTVAKI